MAIVGDWEYFGGVPPKSVTEIRREECPHPRESLLLKFDEETYETAAWCTDCHKLLGRC